MVGLNCKMNVYRITTPADDYIGGALVSGTLVYSSVSCRFESAKPEMMLLQQGLEIPKLYTVLCQPASMVIHELDEVELISPIAHPLRGERFVVRGNRITSMSPSDARGYLILYVARSDYAHSYPN